MIKNFKHTWQIKKLKEISLIKGKYGSGAKAVEYNKNSPRYVRITDIDDKGSLKDMGLASPSEIEEEYFLEDGDLLFARSGSVGKTYLYNKQDGKCQYAGYLICFKLNNDLVNKKYVSLFTKSKFYWQWVKQMKSTMTISNINAKKYSNLEIPIPSIETQNKIVEILEKVEELKKHRQIADDLTNSYLKSVFFEMFGDPGKNEKKFKTEILKNLCEFKSGGTPSRQNIEFFEGNIPWITTIALGSKLIGYDDAVEYITDEAIEQSSTKLVPENSVIIGTRVGVGKTSINKCPMCTNQDIVSLTKIDEKINKYFLLELLNQYKEYFQDNTRGATIKGISSKILKELEIIIPPIELQNTFAEIIERIEKIKEYQKQSKIEIDNLFNNLMQKAFKGELAIK